MQNIILFIIRNGLDIRLLKQNSIKTLVESLYQSRNIRNQDQPSVTKRHFFILIKMSRTMLSANETHLKSI